MTRKPSPNRELMKAMARWLEPILDEVVFVGGQVAELLITDPAAVHTFSHLSSQRYSGVRLA